MKLIICLIMFYSVSSFGAGHPWPFVPKEIGHSFSSFQDYSNNPYFHRGLDIIGRSGEQVFASTSGKVLNARQYGWDDSYWEVVIKDDEGFVWKYHHIEPNSIPESIFEAAKVGARVEVGTNIGEIVDWMIRPYGKDFHHLHLEISDSEGNYVNPFLLLEPLTDQLSPEILRVGLLKYSRPSRVTKIRGSYGLFVETRDLIQSDKFYVPPYLIEYKLDEGDWVTVWRFDVIPGGDNKRKDVTKLFIPDVSCGDYSCRKFFINLGYPNTIFPTTLGNHSIKVRVLDFAKNSSIKVFSWKNK